MPQISAFQRKSRGPSLLRNGKVCLALLIFASTGETVGDFNGKLMNLES
jgi:hypothetical protein